jgi:hypothetical protein
MLYLIGGVPRVGKTTLARMLLSRMGVPFVPADVLASMINDLVPAADIRFGAFDTWERIPEKFFPYIKSFAGGIAHHAPEYTIEGDSFFPAQAKMLIDEHGAKACFLGASSINLGDIKIHSSGTDWVSDLPQAEQDALPEWIVEKSTMIKAECLKYNIPYFDMAIEREATLETAYDYLTAL